MSHIHDIIFFFFNYLLQLLLRHDNLATYILPPSGGKARLSARVTSPEVNEVFKRNSQLWQAELSPGSKEVIPVVTTTETRQEPTVSYSMFGECGERGSEKVVTRV